jgi:hypothetical protein
VGEAVEGEAEGCAAPGGEGRLDFNERAVDCAGEGSEDPMNALQGEPAFGVGEPVAGHAFGEHDGGRRLAFDARGKTCSAISFTPDPARPPMKPARAPLAMLRFGLDLLMVGKMRRKPR